MCRSMIHGHHSPFLEEARQATLLAGLLARGGARTARLADQDAQSVRLPGLCPVALIDGSGRKRPEPLTVAGPRGILTRFPVGTTTRPSTTQGYSTRRRCHGWGRKSINQMAIDYGLRHGQEGYAKRPGLIAGAGNEVHVAEALVREAGVRVGDPVIGTDLADGRFGAFERAAVVDAGRNAKTCGRGHGAQAFGEAGVLVTALEAGVGVGSTKRFQGLFTLLADPDARAFVKHTSGLAGRVARVFVGVSVGTAGHVAVLGAWLSQTTALKFALARVSIPVLTTDLDLDNVRTLWTTPTFPLDNRLATGGGGTRVAVGEAVLAADQIASVGRASGAEIGNTLAHAGGPDRTRLRVDWAVRHLALVQIGVAVLATNTVNGLTSTRCAGGRLAFAEIVEQRPSRTTVCLNNLQGAEVGVRFAVLAADLRRSGSAIERP